MVDCYFIYSQDKGHAKKLYKELDEMVNSIKIFLGQLRLIMDSDTADTHRENLQQLALTSSTSENLLVLLTEKEDEIRALKEQNSKRMRQLEDEKQSQYEQAKLFEIDYRVEAEENEVLRAENDILKHQLDSGLVVSLDDEGDDNADEIDDLKRVISGLKARVRDLDEDRNKLRDHSKEQSRQILKYKQQVEVSEVSISLSS